MESEQEDDAPVQSRSPSMRRLFRDFLLGLVTSSFDAAERIHNPFPGGIEKALDPLSPILVRSLQSKKDVIYYSIIIRLRTYAVKLSEVKKTALPNELLKSSSLENDSICLRKSLRT